jgi:hypothetical protein
MGTPSSGSRGGRPTTADYDHRGGGSSVVSGAVSHYAAQLKSCEMRYTILRNELDDVAAEERQLNVKKTKINKGTELIAFLSPHLLVLGSVASIVIITPRSLSVHVSQLIALFPHPQLPNTCRTNATSSKPSYSCS